MWLNIYNNNNKYLYSVFLWITQSAGSDTFELITPSLCIMQLIKVLCPLIL